MQHPQIILIRHGETAWNAEERRLSYTDVPLDERGQQQASQIAAFLRDYPIQHIFHTGLQRTQHIAEAIARAVPGAMLHLDERFCERNHGDFEGTPRVVVNGVDATSLLSDEEKAEHGVEPLPHVWERVQAGYREVRSITTSDASVIVSHSGPLRLLVADLLGLGVDGRGKVDILPGSITIVELHPNGEEVVTLTNSMAHFSDPQHYGNPH